MGIQAREFFLGGDGGQLLAEFWQNDRNEVSFFKVFLKKDLWLKRPSLHSFNFLFLDNFEISSREGPRAQDQGTVTIRLQVW